MGLLCCAVVLLQQLGCLVRRFQWPFPLPPRVVDGGGGGDVDNAQVMTTVVVVLTVDDVQVMASVMRLVLQMMPRSWRLQRCQCRCVVAAKLATVMILVTVSSPSQSCRG